jgi:hypothetical protein
MAAVAVECCLGYWDIELEYAATNVAVPRVVACLINGQSWLIDRQSWTVVWDEAEVVQMICLRNEMWQEWVV